MLLYAITQRSLFTGDENARAEALHAQARRLARSGVHYLQIREKDLPITALQSLATSIVSAVRSEGTQMRILLNGPAAIAAKAGCSGIHLSSNTPNEDALAARRLFSQTGRPCIISAASHSFPEIQQRRNCADLLLFAPVFEKITPHGIVPGVGLSALSAAVKIAQEVPVLALGGVTTHNAKACTETGAAGIAAIRLFVNEDWAPLL